MDLFDYADVFLRFGKVGCLLQANWTTPVKIRSLSATGTRGYAELENVRRSLTSTRPRTRRGPVVRTAHALQRGRARAHCGRARRAAAARARRLRARRRRWTGRDRVRRGGDGIAGGRREHRRRGGARPMDRSSRSRSSATTTAASSPRRSRARWRRATRARRWSSGTNGRPTTRAKWPGATPRSSS